MRPDDLADPIFKTGPGTPTGDLLRQSWHPIAVASELTEEKPIRPVRVLSEGLVLFRDLGGRLGLIQERCTHHGILMHYGYVTEDSLMCPGHGWQFDPEGNCFIGISQGRRYDMNWAKARAYAVAELGGLFWAYLGELPAPPLPSDDVLTSSDPRRITVHPILARNWLAVDDDESAGLPDGYLPAIPARTRRFEDGSLWLQTPIDDTHTWQVTLALVPNSGDLSEQGVEVVYLDPAAATSAPLDTSRYAPWFRNT